MLEVNNFNGDPHLARQPGPDPGVVEGRGHQARDHQLPHAQAGEGRAVRRAHLRSHEGLGVLLREVQAHPVQGHHLRQVRRRGHALEGPPRADGPHPAGQPRRAHLVLQGHARAASASCSTSAPATSSGSCTSPCTSSPTSTRRRASAPCRPSRSSPRVAAARAASASPSSRRRSRPTSTATATSCARRSRARRPSSRRQRNTRIEEIARAAQAVEAALAELGTGEAAETIAFVPTGEVVVEAGKKGGKDALARLRKIVDRRDRAHQQPSPSSAPPTRSA